MSDVIIHSTSKMSDADLTAIATYLKSLPATGAHPVSAPDAAQMAQGQAIYTDECSACHAMNGTGVPGLFPPLAGNANVQQINPLTIDHFILTGTRLAPTDARPTPFAMPAFAWKLDNRQVAAVATYIRNAWGNRASPVSAGDISSLRGKVAAHPIRKPPSKV
jgi:mono/diheme cytochrome c family protein